MERAETGQGQTQGQEHSARVSLTPPAGTCLVFQPRPPEPPADQHGFRLSRAEADPTAPCGRDAESRGKLGTVLQGGKCA